MTDSEKQIREAFRKYAIENGFADLCIIDYDDYACISYVSGCFKNKNGKWIVYDTDDWSRPFNIQKYKSAKLAYRKLSQKYGFCF